MFPDYVPGIHSGLWIYRRQYLHCLMLLALWTSGSGIQCSFYADITRANIFNILWCPTRMLWPNKIRLDGTRIHLYYIRVRTLCAYVFNVWSHSKYNNIILYKRQPGESLARKFFIFSSTFEAYLRFGKIPTYPYYILFVIYIRWVLLTAVRLRPN